MGHPTSQDHSASYEMEYCTQRSSEKARQRRTRKGRAEKKNIAAFLGLYQVWLVQCCEARALPPVVCHHTHALTHTCLCRSSISVSSPPQGWVIASTGVEPLLRGMRAAGGGAAVVVVAQWAGSQEVLRGREGARVLGSALVPGTTGCDGRHGRGRWIWHSGRAWVLLGRALIHVSSIPYTVVQHTAHSTTQHSTAHLVLGGRLDATRRLPTGCQLPPPWFAGSLVWCQVAWLARVGAPPAWGHPRSPAALSSPCVVAPVLACLPDCLPALLARLACFACFLACGLGLFVACGLVARPTGLDSGLRVLDLSAAVSRRHTKDSIDRQTGWPEVAKLPGYKSQRLTRRPPWPPARPRPAAPRRWVSFLQQPTPRPARALSPPSGPLVGPVVTENSRVPVEQPRERERDTPVPVTPRP